MTLTFPHRSVGGFTLIELLISTSIFMLLAVIVIANYPDSEMKLKLAEINQNVSLAFREAQMRGSAIDSKNSSIGGYGIYLASNAPNKLILFNDVVDSAIPPPNSIPIGDGLYETGPVDETNTLLTLPSRVSIVRLCILGSNGSYSCDSANTPPITNLTVTYIRPNPMPKIYINGDRSTSYSGACVQLQTPKAPTFGHVRNVQIFNSGLIKTMTGPC